MITLHDWILLLRHAGSAIGFPLVVAGLGLMFFGWRMWKLGVILAYSLIVILISRFFLGPGDHHILIVICVGVLLGLLSFSPMKYAIALLGGLLGGGLTMHFLAALGAGSVVQWSMGVAACLGCTAFAHLYRSHVIVLLSAMSGAVLLLSGLTAWITSIPQLDSALRTMTAESHLVLLFILSVPTVISCFFQTAELHRLGG